MEYNEEFIRDFYYNKLDFCGCGDPSSILFFIKEILNAIDYRFKDRSSNSYEEYVIKMNTILNLKEDRVTDTFHTNIGVEGIILNVLNNCDVLEHGGSIFGSWLTEYGEELLSYLNDLTNEELEYILG